MTFRLPFVLSVALILSGIGTGALATMGAALPDSCTFASTYVSYDALTKCLTDVPFNQTAALSTLETLNKMVPSYVFVDISRDAPLQVDIVARLGLIQQQVIASQYTTDRAFQVQIAELMNSLQDAHTRYSKPSPYRNAMYLQPFTLRSLILNGTQTIQLVYQPEWTAAYKTVYGVDPFSVNCSGFIVTQIDGQNPFGIISQFADTIGYSKDAGARFNLAVDGYGGTFYGVFTARNQTLNDIPASPSIAWSLLDPITGLTVNESVNFLGKYNSFTTAAPQSLASQRVDTRKRVVLHELEELRRDAVLSSGRPLSDMYSYLPSAPLVSNPVLQSAAAGDTDTLVTIVNDTANGVMVQVLNGAVGILRIATWSPANETTFAQSVMTGMVSLNNSGITKVIFDMRLNGGGDICLAYAALRFLFPDVAPTVGAYDMKHSDLWGLFVSQGAALQKTFGAGSTACGTDPEQLGYFTPCAWSSPFTGYGVEFVPFADDSWFNPGQTFTRGSVDSKYSSFIHEGCQDAYSLWIPQKVLVGSKVDDLLLLSDGLCGSSCAVFSRHLQDIRKVKTVSVGGLYGSDMGIASFPGGEVEDLPFVFSMVEKYNVSKSDPLIPPPFPNNAMFRYAIREIYPFSNFSENSPTPLEFTPSVADFRVFYGESSGYYPGADSLAPLYAATSQFFAACAPWQQQSCAVANGQGVKLCVNETYASACTVTACNPGFGNQDGVSCSVCPVGTFNDGTRVSCQSCTNRPPNSMYTKEQMTSNQCQYTCQTGFAGFLCDAAVPVEEGFGTGALAGAVIGSVLGGAIVAALMTVIFMKRRVSSQYEKI